MKTKLLHHNNYGLVPLGGYPTFLKCNGDAMEFSLSQEAADDLNCSLTGGATTCAGQFAGLTITKTDANHNQIDDDRYVGTSDWAFNNGIFNSVFYQQEDFIDATGTTDNVQLLNVVNNYMTNNYGFYTLTFTYESKCGKYKEHMYIEYGATPSPVFTWNTNNIDVPTSSDINNPINTCSNFPELNSDGISSSGMLDSYFLEVFDLTTNTYVGNKTFTKVLKITIK